MMMKLPSVRIDCKHELGGTKLLDGKYNDGGKLREEFIYSVFHVIIVDLQNDGAMGYLQQDKLIWQSSSRELLSWDVLTWQ